MTASATIFAFLELKSRDPGVILVFCVGEFCEVLGEHAIEAARLLDLPLETLDDGPDALRLVRFQRRNLETHLAAIVASGRRAAVCEPVSAAEAKRVLKQEITLSRPTGRIAMSEAKDRGWNTKVVREDRFLLTHRVLQFAVVCKSDDDAQNVRRALEIAYDPVLAVPGAGGSR